MDMQYALREGVLTVRLFGELGHHEAIQGMARLAGLVEDLLPGGFLLELSGLDFMDSSGIAVALRGWQRMRELGGAVTLYHVAQQPRKVFEASGVGRMVTIV